MLWYDIVSHLADFPSAVLTGVDATGYPFSIRCKPEPDAIKWVLRVQIPENTDIQPGPTGLLCHKHDKWLWNLKSFIVRGTLEQDAQGWILRRQQFIPGTGIGGVMGMAQFVRIGRRTAKRYLKKRGLARPGIPWDKIHTVWAETRGKGVKTE